RWRIWSARRSSSACGRPGATASGPPTCWASAPAPCCVRYVDTGWRIRGGRPAPPSAARKRGRAGRRFSLLRRRPCVGGLARAAAKGERPTMKDPLPAVRDTAPAPRGRQDGPECVPHTQVHALVRRALENLQDGVVLLLMVLLLVLSLQALW